MRMEIRINLREEYIQHAYSPHEREVSSGYQATSLQSELCSLECEPIHSYSLKIICACLYTVNQHVAEFALNSPSNLRQTVSYITEYERETTSPGKIVRARGIDKPIPVSASMTVTETPISLSHSSFHSSSLKKRNQYPPQTHEKITRKRRESKSKSADLCSSNKLSHNSPFIKCR